MNARLLPLFAVALAAGAVRAAVSPAVPEPAAAREAAEAVVFGASLPPVAWLVRTIGGGAVRCEPLVREGADPHSFEPTPRDWAALAGAQAFFASGMPFEEALGVRLSRRDPGLRFVRLPVSEGDSEDGADEPHAHDDRHGHGDAHAHDDLHGWLSPAVLADWAGRIADELVRAGAVPEAAARAAAAAVARDAEALLREGRERLSAAGVRGFGTFHPAFGAFAGAFGLEQTALEDEGKSPGPRRLAEAKERLAAAGAAVFFVRNGAERRQAEAFVRGTPMQVVEVAPLGPDPFATIRSLLDALAPVPAASSPAAVPAAVPATPGP